ncbi:TonB-dependent receptor [Cytophagaceae bacterium DM2B3-1]|uniref:TonB-dependent receptor n=1 Tax=Xanthocytophaga flava TaxID=3048013 RepID=A0ABT7CTH5_9BACT|nr:TonB-dependent receptor [Xanthocytophaga flavus]MDJ1497033.1 TonB-dependent receptor [Xanthocytophaga flavus]
MKKIFYSALLLSISFSAWAQDNAASNQYINMSLEELMNVQVESASKKSENLFDTPFSASVLTKEEIRKAGATSIMEALRLVPGVIVREQSNGNYDIHLRGLDNVPPSSFFMNSINSTTLVMIDNRPVYNYLQGGTYWETLPIDLNDVEKIEVVRGPAAAMYGPNAVSGVINIITQKNAGNVKNVQAVANAQYGSLNTLIANSSIGHQFTNKLSATVSGNYQSRGRDVSYYDLKTDQTVDSPSKLTHNTITPLFAKPDRSMQKYGANAFVNYKENNNIRFDLAAGLQGSEVQKVSAENTVTPMSVMRSNSTYADLKGVIYGLTSQVSYISGEQDPIIGQRGSKYAFSALDAAFEYEVKLKHLSIKPGYSYRKALYDDTKFWSAENSEGVLSGRYYITTHAASVRTEYNLFQDKVRLAGALRMDKFNYPDKWYLSYQLAGTFKPSDSHLFRVVYSRAFRSPFIYDNYINLALQANSEQVHSTTLVTGNKNLQQLQSDMVELGYRSKLASNLQLDLETYYIQTSNYTNLIVGQRQIQPGAPVQVTTYINVQNIPLTVNQWGTTLSLNYVHKQLQIKPFVSWQKTLLYDYSYYNNTADGAQTSDGSDPATNNINSGIGTTKTHKATPSVYGGAFINYQFNTKFNLNINPYFFTNQTLSHQNASYTVKSTAVDTYKVDAKVFVNAKFSYSPNKVVTVFVTGRNLLNKRSAEYFHTDAIGSMYLGGINLNLGSL